MSLIATTYSCLFGINNTNAWLVHTDSDLSINSLKKVGYLHCIRKHSSDLTNPLLTVWARRLKWGAL
ncbi:hypothetical protein VPMS16_2331 [Vibrio sp. 16]|nr:hypothetical protein VPMS16_2331 [Vibrio sp. 16]